MIHFLFIFNLLQHGIEYDGSENISNYSILSVLVIGIILWIIKIVDDEREENKRKKNSINSRNINNKHYTRPSNKYVTKSYTNTVPPKTQEKKDVSFTISSSNQSSSINKRNSNYVKDQTTNSNFVNEETKLDFLAVVNRYGYRIIPESEVDYNDDEKKLVKCNITNHFYPYGDASYYNLAYYVKNGTEIIGEKAFAGMVLLRYIVLPESLIRIEDKAFHSKDKIISVDFPDSLKEIGKFAFFNCGLTDVNLNKVEVINEQAFGFCKFTKVFIPSTVRYIGDCAFSNYNNPVEFELAPQHKYFQLFEGGLYSDSKKRLITFTKDVEEPILPKEVEIIGKFAFHGKKIRKIVFPSKVKKVLESSLDCNGLQEVYFNDEIEEIIEAFGSDKIGRSNPKIQIYMPYKIKSLRLSLTKRITLIVPKGRKDYYWNLLIANEYNKLTEKDIVEL